MKKVNDDDKSEGLEIVSIGKLYSGSWEKKYWSSSRGKDRYPYPIGYNAVRTQHGITYKMEILEGLKGPLFMISCTDGKSCSGQTPDMAWDRFQKKGSSQIKLWHGKRFSSKIDGVEFFGFKNPLVQRLLRELVANVSESAYPVIPPSTSGRDVLEKTNQIQCVDSTTKSANITSLPKPRVTRKRSRTYKGTNIKATGKAGGTMVHSGNENHSSDAPNSTEFTTASAVVDPHGSCSAAQSTLVPMNVESEEKNGSRPPSQNGCLDLNHLNNLAVKVDDLCLQKPTRHSYSDFDNKSMEQSGSMPKDKEFLDRSMVVDVHDIEIKADLGEGEQTFISDSLQNVDDTEIRVPDTSDIPLDNSCDNSVQVSSEAPDSVKDDITATQMTDSGTLITESHPDDVTNSVAPTNSQKNDFDSVKSMMTVLLPRALPLLKTFSRKRKHNGKSSKRSLSNKDNTERGLCKDISPTEQDAKLNLTNQIQMEHCPTSDSIAPNKVHVDAFIPDTFDDDEIGYKLTEQQAFHSNCAEPGPTSSSQGHSIDKTFNQAVSINAEVRYPLSHVVVADFANPGCQDVRTHSDSSEQKCISSIPPQETTTNANISGIYESHILDPKEACGLEINLNIQHMPASKSSEASSKNIPNGVCLTTNVIKEALEEQVSETDSLASHFHNNEEGDVNEELYHGLHLQAATYSNQYLKLIARYGHPMPIKLVLLSKKQNEIYICALCGIPQDEEAVLFFYKAQMEGQDFGSPSFCGHSSIMLPSARDVFGRNITVEKSGFQLSPDARSLVLFNSIRTPYCSDGNLKCSCGSCKANSCENNAVKIVQVKGGFVTVVTKLKTTGCVCCILVCGPTSLVAAEESGKLYLWVMSSSWSAATAEYVLPTPDCIPPCTLELKKIPKAASLIIGHNGVGEFCLWDINKQIILSKISSPNTLVRQLIPVSLFRSQTKGLDFVNSNLNETINEIMDATKTWMTETNESLADISENIEDVGIWLLISGEYGVEHGHGSKLDVDPTWHLALLVKHTMIVGSVLDLRAAAAGASAGHGIIGRSDGLVYIWELSTGINLGNLHHFKGGRMSCIAVDDSGSDVFAIASNEGHLLVYKHS